MAGAGLHYRRSLVIEQWHADNPREQGDMRILTFNIEDWFHLLDASASRDRRRWTHYESRIHENTDRILRALAETRQPATFFCLGWIAERYPDLVRTIDSLGYEIGVHSHTHQIAYRQGPSEFAEDLRRSIGALSAITGKRVRLYRAPGFSLTHRNAWAFDILAGQGIEIDCSVFPTARGNRKFKGFGAAEPTLIKYGACRMKEFPVSAACFAGAKIAFSGAAFFRIYPYALIRRLTAEAAYVMAWFHPRDFDPEQPVARGLSAAKQYAAYAGLYGSFTKFKDFLRDFTFMDIRSAETQIDWSRAKVIMIEPNNEFTDTNERIGPVRVAPWGSFKVKEHD